MFKSIRWRFVVIYFLLIFLAMSIVGFFIITRFENIQLNMNSKNMKTRITSIYQSSSAMQTDNWNENIDSIKSNVSTSIQLGYNENVYIILNDMKRTVIASSISSVENLSAYDIDKINNEILTKGSTGVTDETIIYDKNDNITLSHIVYPVKNQNDDIKGYIYLTSDISYIYTTLNQTKYILTQATYIALAVTVLLGLILSRTITGPIKDLTMRTKQLSLGNFEQKVAIKSNDEIGQLGKTFNYLIDELKLSMSKLNQEKSKIETTLTYMADGVLTVDRKGDVLQMNPVAKRILNAKSKETCYDQIISRRTHDLYLDKIQENNWNGTYVLQTDNETYKVDYAPFMDGNNQIGGVILVFKNVTEQFKMDKLQKEFVANVSHELKTPITTVKSYTETLLEGAMEDKEIATDFLKVIDSESDRMSRLVSDLLKLSRMDYQETKWNKETLSINEIVKGAHTKLILQAKNKNITMPLTLDSRNSNVLFDRDGLEQILLNIIGNAIKYTLDGGEVSIKVTGETSKVVISIKDSGIGIPKEDIEHVFERFYRVDKARTRKLGGTGLGLSIASQIAKAHDSILEIKSELNVGTTVQIKIPKVLK